MVLEPALKHSCCATRAFLEEPFLAHLPTLELAGGAVVGDDAASKVQGSGHLFGGLELELVESLAGGAAEEGA